MLSCLLAVLLAAPVAHFETQPIEDTYLDAQLPDLNFGHDPLLVGGPKSAILVRFPGLSWIPEGQIPDTAVLTLHLVEPSDVKLTSVRRVIAPWREGSGLRLPMPHTNSEQQLAGTATWAYRSSGQSKWQTAGASGDKDSVPIDGAQLVVEGSTVRITGLGKALADMVRHPESAYGLRLEFGNTVTFASADNAAQKPHLDFSTKAETATGPRLAVTALEPDGDQGWTATVMNTGDAPCTGWHAVWAFKGVQVDESDSQRSMAPGDTVKIQIKPSFKLESQPRKNILSVTVESGGQGGQSAKRDVAVNGLPVRFAVSVDAREAFDKYRGNETEALFWQRVTTCVNEAVLAQSKTSFAPDGCWERLRVASSDEPALTVPINSFGTAEEAFGSIVEQTVRAVSPLKGAWRTPPDSQAVPDISVGWQPDTRDDTLWQTALTLPQFPWGAPKELQPALPSRGLLGRSEVALLNSMAGFPFADRAKHMLDLPKAMILVLVDGAGNALSNAEVEMFQTHDGQLTSGAKFKKTATNNGYVVLGSVNDKGPFGDLDPLGANSWMLVRATKDFVTETAWLPATTLMAEAARGNAAPTVELRFMIGSGELKADDDLAANKIVTDSLGRFPAELNALVDGDPKTAVEVNAGDKPYTLDIDLGRDRLIAGVELETDGKLWDNFELQVSRTGQKDQFDPWFIEGSGPLRIAERGQKVQGKSVVTYVASAVRARTLRLKVKSGGPVQLSAVRVRTLKQGQPAQAR